MNGTNIPSMLDGICCMEVYIKFLSNIYPFIQHDSKVLHEMLGWFAVTYTKKKWVTGISSVPGVYIKRLFLTCSKLCWYLQTLSFRAIFLLMYWLLSHIIKVERYFWCINYMCRESSGVFKEWFLAVNVSTLSQEPF